MDETKKIKKRNAAVAMFVAAIMVASVMMFVFSDDADDDAGLGFFDDTPLGAPVATPAIAAGNQHSLYLRSDGTVWAWGFNTYGQLGNNTTTSSSTPVQVKNLTGVIAIAAGSSHSLALKSDGTVWAWGFNIYGQLGDNSTTNRSVPVQVRGDVDLTTYMTGVTAIAAGNNHSLALRGDEIRAWGDNSNGQLSILGIEFAEVPRKVLVSGGSVLTGVEAIAAGGDHSLALKSDKTVLSWGYNLTGQLGIGTFGASADENRPTQVHKGNSTSSTANLEGVIAISGGNIHSLAVKSDGTVWAWGYNVDGRLGDGTSGASAGKSMPVQVGVSGSWLDDVTAVAGGSSHSLALKNDGTVWAWGNNTNGQLGDNSETQRLVPVKVAGQGGSGDLTNVKAIAAGSSHSLALKNDGTVWAWGNNMYGQLGDGTNTPSSTPVQVKLPSSAGGGLSMTVIAVVAVAAIAAIGAAVWFFFLRK